MGSMERSLGDAHGLIDSPSLKRMQLKSKHFQREALYQRSLSNIDKKFPPLGLAGLALSDPLFLFVNHRLHEELRTFLACTVVKILIEPLLSLKAVRCADISV